MSYKALYRTYRPQTFNEVTGQQHIVKTIKNAVNENRIAHAYLFCGPRGTGKTTIAKLFAKAVNCTGDSKPCDTCPNCISIAKGDHPDVIEMDAASNNGVDEVRNLIETVNYAPINGKYKVYIIDEVHMMSTGAFNALLKTLEEPPAHAIFILATTEPHKVLPTIISRCQRYDFKKIDDSDIVSRLQDVLESENIAYDSAALNIIAKLSQGGMRDALSIMEQCLAYSENLSVDNVNTVYGLLSMEHKINFIKCILAKDIKGALRLIDEMTSSSIDIKRLTYDLVDVLKDVILYKNIQDCSILIVLSDSDIEMINPYITVAECFEYIDILLDTASKYNQTLNPNMYFEVAVLKLCNRVKTEVKEATPIAEVSFEPTPDPVKLDPEVTPLSTESPELEVEPVTNEEPPRQGDEIGLAKNVSRETSEAPVEQYSVEPSIDDIMNILVQAKRKYMENIKERWAVINRYQYNLNTAKFASMLISGDVVAACDKAFILSYEYQVEVNQVNSSDNYHSLKKFLSEVLGEELEFIALEANQWQKMRQHFIDLKRNEQLPSPGPINLSHIVAETTAESLTEGQKLAIDLFGEIVEIEE